MRTMQKRLRRIRRSRTNALLGAKLPHAYRTVPTARCDLGCVLAWSGILLGIGGAAFAFGMTIHARNVVALPTARNAPIYYCATGVEMPPFVPCKAQKSEMHI